MRRSDMGVKKIKDMIEMKEIKKPIKSIVWYSKGWLHNGSHFMNLIEHWLGKTRAIKIIKVDRTLGLNDVEATIHFELDNGEALFICGWEEYFSHYTIEMLCKNGKLNYSDGGKLIEWRETEPDQFIKGYTRIGGKPRILETGMEKSQYHVIDQLAKALRGEEADLCSGTEALQVIAIMDQILQSCLKQ